MIYIIMICLLYFFLKISLSLKPREQKLFADTVLYRIKEVFISLGEKSRKELCRLEGELVWVQ
ncbi:MAG: hypothetical protein K0S61_1442 [Anaerocolumna sp.]|jgi:hypothetical protein|nr:hypothetical protein [Anaerocolumna sp.]